ncbi:hypothetical protein [Levilactobacillus phage ENFP1]|nr:hypothetical protein [Levilactobacillus phage ENFP1]
MLELKTNDLSGLFILTGKELIAEAKVDYNAYSDKTIPFNSWFYNDFINPDKVYSCTASLDAIEQINIRNNSIKKLTIKP